MESLANLLSKTRMRRRHGWAASALPLYMLLGPWLYHCWARMILIYRNKQYGRVGHATASPLACLQPNCALGSSRITSLTCTCTAPLSCCHHTYTTYHLPPATCQLFLLVAVLLNLNRPCLSTSCLFTCPPACFFDSPHPSPYLAVLNRTTDDHTLHCPHPHHARTKQRPTPPRHVQHTSYPQRRLWCAPGRGRGKSCCLHPAPASRCQSTANARYRAR